MKCIKCDGATRIEETRKVHQTNTVERRRVCKVCLNKFITVELERKTASDLLENLKKSYIKSIEVV